MVHQPRDEDTLIHLLNIDNKKELRQYCKNLIIHRSDFCELIQDGMSGLLSPYIHQRLTYCVLPEHLNLVPQDFAELINQGTQSRTAKKLISKTFQSLEERRFLVCHVFYTLCLDYWHLFYYDQRDQEEEEINHWTEGQHIHFLNFLLVSNPFTEVMAAVEKGDINYKGKLHLRYTK